MDINSITEDVWLSEIMRTLDWFLNSTNLVESPVYKYDAFMEKLKIVLLKDFECLNMLSNLMQQ